MTMPCFKTGISTKRRLLAAVLVVLAAGVAAVVAARPTDWSPAASGQAAFEIFPESETKFFLKVVDGQVEFVKDATGMVTGMVMTQNGRTIPGKKIKRLTE